MQRLCLDELAERLADHGNVRAVKQPVDVLGRSKDQPVERKLK